MELTKEEALLVVGLVDVVLKQNGANTNDAVLQLLDKIKQFVKEPETKTVEAEKVGQ